MKLTTHLHLVPRLRTSETVNLFPQHAFMTWTETSFFFIYIYLFGGQWFKFWHMWKSNCFKICRMGLLRSVGESVVSCMNSVLKDWAKCLSTFASWWYIHSEIPFVILFMNTVFNTTMLMRHVNLRINPNIFWALQWQLWTFLLISNINNLFVFVSTTIYAWYQASAAMLMRSAFC